MDWLTSLLSSGWTYAGALGALATAAGGWFAWRQAKAKERAEEALRQAGRDEATRASLEKELEARKRMQEAVANAPDNDKSVVDRLRDRSRPI